MKLVKNRTKLIYILMAIILLVVAIIISLKIGSIKISYRELIFGLFSDNPSGNIEIIRDLRMPRVFVAALVGANLAISGVLLQSVIKNPLADPYITGISSGASLVAVSVIVFAPRLIKFGPMFGLLGGAISCLIVYGMAYKNGLSPIRIVLAGAAVNALLGGLTVIVTLCAGSGASNMQMWLAGSLAKISWIDFRILIGYSVVGIIVSILLSKSCNIIVLGNKNASSLGYNSTLQMILITTVAVFLAGISTAIAGIISFVGLVVPHICRIIIGSDHKYLIPFSGVLGSALLLLADTLGRSIIKPYEIPVGIVMAIIGAPFFLYLLKRSDI
ncbi:iron ABC transporter permease [Clostridium sardiniense]